jgi:hypothetical protein
MARIRNIKRNTSNQIISYSIPPNSDVEYGVVRLPAVETVYGIDSYNRTLDRLSGDLLQQVDTDGNVFTDTFSGRYEITDSARTYNGTLDRQDINIFFDTIPWDNVVNGPTLEDGAYRITKELIDSGKNLRLKATIAISNDTQTKSYFKSRISSIVLGLNEPKVLMSSSISLYLSLSFLNSLFICSRDMIYIASSFMPFSLNLSAILLFILSVFPSSKIKCIYSLNCL